MKGCLVRAGHVFRVFGLFWLFSLLSGPFFYPTCRADLVDLLEIPVPVPERDVSLKSDATVLWKARWDEARFLVRTGDFSGAEIKYEELLFLKGNLELPRWEYGRLLLKNGKWAKASEIIERLVEKDPGRVEYLTGLALALRRLGKFGRALDLFQKAIESDPHNLTALAGLAQGLVEVGRKKEAFPLFEEILTLRPADLSIQRSLANLAFELGKLETARKLMAPLVGRKDADLDTLLMTARIYEELNQDKTAIIYWQRCLAHDPDNREARGRLALYYEKMGETGKALPHLLALLENDPKNASLLSRICRIYIQDDLFSAALPYFERYVQLEPDNLDELMPVGKDNVDSGSDAIALYRRLLAVTPDDLELLDALAKDLLMAGDPEAALFMWEHVARLDPDRAEVYQEIVDLLERLGRDERLTEVLEVLHRLAPGEVKVVSKLANLKVAQGDLPVGLEYYNKLEDAGYGGADLFEGRGALFEDLGRLGLALENFRKLLAIKPNRIDIRRRAIVLAGKLGENIFLREQVALLDAANDKINRDEDLLLVARAFADASDIDQSVARYRRVITSRTEADAGQNNVGRQDFLQRQAKFGLAELYSREGMSFEAEQVLREVFLASPDQEDVLKRLFDLALTSNNLNDAGIWLARYESTLGGTVDAVMMRARFYTASGDYGLVEDLLGNLMYNSATGGKFTHVSTRKADVIRQAGLLMAEVFIESEDLDQAERQCLAMLGADQDRDVLVLLYKVYSLVGKSGAAENIFNQLVGESGDSSELLSLARLFRRYRLASGQASTAAQVLQNSPGSLAAAFLRADGLVGEGNIVAAIKLLESMVKRYPGNSSIINVMAGYYYLSGQYASALQLFERFLERNPKRLDAYFLKAHCVKALGDLESARNMVHQIFPVEVDEIVAKNIYDAGLDVSLPPAKRTMFQVLTFSAAERLSLARKLMSTDNLLDNSTKEKKELNLIAVRLYARYRWEQEFRKSFPPA